MENTKQQKYEILYDQPKEYEGHTVYPTRALIEIEGVCEKGDLGPYVENEKNLSQEGNSWVKQFPPGTKQESYILGENTFVGGNVELDGAVISNGAQIDDDGKIVDSKIDGPVVLEGRNEIINSTLKDNVRLKNNFIENTKLGGELEFGECAVHDSELQGNAKVFKAKLYDIKNENFNNIVIQRGDYPNWETINEKRGWGDVYRYNDNKPLFAYAKNDLINEKDDRLSQHLMKRIKDLHRVAFEKNKNVMLAICDEKDSVQKIMEEYRPELYHFIKENKPQNIICELKGIKDQMEKTYDKNFKDTHTWEEFKDEYQEYWVRNKLPKLEEKIRTEVRSKIRQDQNVKEKIQQKKKAVFEKIELER